MNRTVSLKALFAGVVLSMAALSAVSQDLLAPRRIDVVSAVITAHRGRIDSCDEEARAALVDYAAQRLNAGLTTPAWGRKSRGKPVNGKAVNPNTDGLTFLRPDGRFEIYDVISGTPPCAATWDGFGPFKPGENGWWAPPQLPAEGGSTPPPPPPPPVDLTPRVRELESKVLLLEGKIRALETAPATGVSEERVRQLIADSLRNVAISGTIGRTFGHSHGITIALSPK